MEDHITLRVLGPVQARAADAQTPQQRLVLAILALRAGHVVPVHELIDAVWEDQPPSSARGSLQALITRLDLLARREMAALSAICGVDGEDITDMIAEIRELNPKPGLAFGAEPVACAHRC